MRRNSGRENLLKNTYLICSSKPSPRGERYLKNIVGGPRLPSKGGRKVALSMTKVKHSCGGGVLCLQLGHNLTGAFLTIELRTGW